MPDISIKITGVDEVVNNLKQLDAKIQSQVLRKAPRVGAKEILPVALSLAPEKSGVLKGNIRIRTSNRASKGIYRASVGIGQKDWTGPAFYGSFVLWGHKAGSRKLGSKRKQVPGNDFLKKAAEQAGGKAAQAMVDAIAKGIEGVK